MVKTWGCTGQHQHTNGIDAKAMGAWRMEAPPFKEQQTETPRLDGGDGLKWASVPHPTSSLDLDRNQGFLLAGDDVELSLSGAPVSSEEREALFGEMFCGELFAKLSETQTS